MFDHPTKTISQTTNYGFRPSRCIFLTFLLLPCRAVPTVSLLRLLTTLLFACHMLCPSVINHVGTYSSLRITSLKSLNKPGEKTHRKSCFFFKKKKEKYKPSSLKLNRSIERNCLEMRILFYLFIYLHWFLFVMSIYHSDVSFRECYRLVVSRFDCNLIAFYQM